MVNNPQGVLYSRPYFRRSKGSLRTISTPAPDTNQAGPDPGPALDAAAVAALGPLYGRGGQPYMRRIAKSTICSTAFASKTIRWSPSMSRTNP